MINLAQAGYTHNQIIDIIQSDYGQTNMQYRLDIVRGGVRLGSVDFDACTITCDSEAAVKYSASISLSDRVDLNRNLDFLRPVQFLDYRGARLEFPLIPLKPVTMMWDREEMKYKIEAYDITYVLENNSLPQTLFIPSGTVYTAQIESMLRGIGFAVLNIVPSGKALLYDREDWHTGDNLLRVINQLLAEIAYRSLEVDRGGMPYARPYEAASLANAKIIYRAGKDSVLLPGRSVEQDSWARPNRFVAEVFTQDMPEPWRVDITNDNPASPTGTVQTGYEITAVLPVDNVADPEALEQLVLRAMSETEQGYERALLETAVMPHHEVGETVIVQADGVDGIYYESGWSMDFKSGGAMTHQLRRVVYD